MPIFSFLNALRSVFKKLILSVFVFLPILASALIYETKFVGLEKNSSCLRAIKDASRLVSLEKRAPASLNGLRFRVRDDIPELMRILRAFAYYEATVRPELIVKEESNGQTVYQVIVYIETGSQFKLSSYEIYNGDCTELAQIVCKPPLNLEQIQLHLGQPALSIDIVNAELNLLGVLADCGYPLAYIDKRRVEVDMAAKTVQAACCIQEGLLSKFGPVTFFGLQNIRPHFVNAKIGWKEGDIYNSRLIKQTEERLLKSDLFASVYITHGDELDEEGKLPMKFRFTETKHRWIRIGGFYGTVDGPGFTFSWAHKNIGGQGDTLSGKGEISKHFIVGNLTYKRPDFLVLNQTYRAFGELSRENIRAYHAFIYRCASYLERSIDPQINFSVGMKLEHINVSSAATNGKYLLFGVPIFVRYGVVDSFLDASQGYSIVYSATPYQSFFYGNQHFVKQRLTTIVYVPLGTKRFVLALRSQYGSIAGTQQAHVPLTKLFLGGSENDLRGYRYKTVSPLNQNRKPLGGRSAILASAEMRWKATQKIGLVSFADFGTVTALQWPDFTAKWLKSVGVGFRYFAFFGPLRFDIGFPLNKRTKIDPNFQIYASVGQTF